MKFATAHICNCIRLLIEGNENVGTYKLYIKCEEAGVTLVMTVAFKALPDEIGIGLLPAASV